MHTRLNLAGGEYRNISAWAIRNPIPICMLFLLLTLAGIVAFPTLRINNSPDLDLPAVVIAVAQPGAGPSEIEALVTRRIEDAISGLGNVRHVTSAVLDGASTTVVEFVLGKDINSAVTEVRDRIAQIRADLPAGLRDPVVTHIEAAGGAILTYAVSAPDRGDKAISRFIDDTITRTLLFIPGVAQVTRIGGVDREIRIMLKPDRILALGVTANQINAQLRDLNLNLPGGRGTVGRGEQTIRTLGSAASVDELRDRTIALSGGRTARLGDLAEVVDGTAEIRTEALLDNRPVVAFSVLRLRGSSEVRVADQVAAAIARLEAANPGVRMRLVANTVDFVKAGLQAAVESFSVGALLAILVVWAFLRDWRATFMASIAIPLSLVPTFFVMNWLGFSLNNVTLLGLTLVVGVLVDDAIVEIENIVRRMRLKPEAGAYRAALDGSAEIGRAVVATTAAILAVFVPVSFMPGIPGQFFRQFGLTVATAVAFSLVVARLLTPLLGAYLLKPGAHEAPQRRRCRQSLLRRTAASLPAPPPGDDRYRGRLLRRVHCARAVRASRFRRGIRSRPHLHRDRTRTGRDARRYRGRGAGGHTYPASAAGSHIRPGLDRLCRHWQRRWSVAWQHQQARRSADGQPDRGPGTPGRAQHEPADVRGIDPAGAGAPSRCAGALRCR